MFWQWSLKVNNFFNSRCNGSCEARTASNRIKSQSRRCLHIISLQMFGEYEGSLVLRRTFMSRAPSQLQVFYNSQNCSRSRLKKLQTNCKINCCCWRRKLTSLKNLLKLFISFYLSFTAFEIVSSRGSAAARKFYQRTSFSWIIKNSCPKFITRQQFHKSNAWLCKQLVVISVAFYQCSSKDKRKEKERKIRKIIFIKAHK